ncbi:hypothetical protein ACFY7Z_17785 [Streptomyces sp. NPDC012623]|uniref:hypothetical protein n=1 Tax=unclassified Streptomyces TaxID=2593676 RepID=UPI0036CC0F2C
MPVEVIFFNVGQGDCTFLHCYEKGAGAGSRGKSLWTVLLDCGTLSAGNMAPGKKDPGARKKKEKEVLAEYLRNQIAERLKENGDVLNYLLISHPDQDHFNLIQDIICHQEKESKTNKLQYEIRNVWYSCDVENYREGRGDYITNLLSDNPGYTVCPDHPTKHKLVKPPVRMQSPTDPVPLFDTTDPNLYFVSCQPYGPHPDEWRPGQKRKDMADGDRLEHPGKRMKLDGSVPAPADQIFAIQQRIIDLKEKGEGKKLQGDELDLYCLNVVNENYGKDYLTKISDPDRVLAAAVVAAKNSGALPPRWLILSARIAQDEETKRAAWFDAEAHRKLGDAYVKDKSLENERLGRIAQMKTRPVTREGFEYDDYLETRAVQEIANEYLKNLSPKQRQDDLDKTIALISTFRTEGNDRVKNIGNPSMEKGNKDADDYNKTKDKNHHLTVPDVLPVKDPVEYNRLVIDYNIAVMKYNQGVLDYNQHFPEAEWFEWKRSLAPVMSLYPDLDPKGKEMQDLAAGQIYATYVEELLTKYRADTRRPWEAKAKIGWANGSSMVFVLKGKTVAQEVWLMADAVMTVEYLLKIRYEKDPFLQGAKDRWLKCGHHGSETSTSSDWVKLLKPTGLFISSGKKNYHIPRSGHMDAIRKAWGEAWGSPDKVPTIDPAKKPNITTGVKIAPFLNHHFVFWKDGGKGKSGFALCHQSTNTALCTSLIPSAGDLSRAAPVSNPPLQGEGADWHLLLDDNGGYELWYE